MSVDPKFIEEIMTKGWRCLYCGENVPDSCDFTVDGNVVCGGMCRSDTCRQLPPGGNPFHVVIS